MSLAKARLASTIILALFVATERPLIGGVLPQGSMVVGKTVAEWTAEYWRWAAQYPMDANPLLDATGELGYLGDVGGPVFFVASSPNGTFNRQFTVPAGEYLLFPLLTDIFPVDPSNGDTLGDAEAYMQGLYELPTLLNASIDGVPVSNPLSHRETSPVFSLDVPANSILPEGHYAQALAGGYWLMLSPLPAGPHTLDFGASIPIADYVTQTTSLVEITTTEPGTIGLSCCVLLVMLGIGARPKVRVPKSHLNA